MVKNNQPMTSDAEQGSGRRGEQRCARYHRVLLLSVVLVGELLAGVLFVLDVPFGSRYFIGLNLGLLTVLTALPVLIRLRTRKLNVAELGLWFTAFYFAHMVLGSLYVLRFGGPPINILPDESIVGALSAGLTVATIAFVCFWFGYSHPIGYRTAERLPQLSSTWERHRLPSIIIGCLIVAWTARLTIMYLASGGVSAWLAMPSTERFLGVPGTTYLKLLGELSALVVFILVALAYRNRDWRLYLATVVVLLPEVTFRLLTGRRRAVPFLLLGLVMTVYLLSDRSFRRSLQYAVAGAGSLLFMILLFPIVTIYRYEGSLSLAAVAGEFQSLRLLRALGHRLIGSNTLSYLIHRVPSEVPHFYGQDFLLIPQTMVPRVLWPGKPQTSMGRLYTERIIPPGEYTAAEAVPPTLPGQLYWSGNLVGVVLGMLFLGIIWRILHNYLAQPRNHAGFAVFVGIMFPSFFFVVEQDFVALFTKHFFRFVLMGSVIVLASADFRETTVRSPTKKSAVLQFGVGLWTAFMNSQMYSTVFWIHEQTVAIGRLMEVAWKKSILRASLKNSNVYSLAQQVRVQLPRLSR
jgi:oligosaccharide repeat unit polymerase